HYYFGNLAGLRSAIAKQASNDLIIPVADALCATTSTDELVQAAVEVTTAAFNDAAGVALLTHMITGAAHYPDVAEVLAEDMGKARAKLARHLVDLDSTWSEAEALDAAGLFIGALDGIVLHAVTFPTGAAAPVARIERLIRTVFTAAS
ncbi:MAG: hypothetical protein M3116_02040, partial [Actinomycetota bacterium]|nr:hypothetical protein [Actinomycetota bacterium]